MKKFLITILLLFIPCISYADVDKKEDFILQKLEIIQEAKEKVGGISIKIPNSLILAQIIIESGWGTSRLYKKRNNPLGLKNGKKYAVFETKLDAVIYYLENLSEHTAYSQFRRILLRGENNVIRLIPFISSYAEDDGYGDLLNVIIAENKLSKYD